MKKLYKQHWNDLVTIKPYLKGNDWVPYLVAGNEIIYQATDIRAKSPKNAVLVAKLWLREIGRQIADKEPRFLLYYRCGYDGRVITMIQEAIYKQYEVWIC